MSQPVDSTGEKFSWLKIREFVFGFSFRYNLNDEPRFCNLGNSGGRSRRPDKPLFKVPKQTYNVPNGVPLKKKKWLDIQKLLDFVPPIHHKFFKDLPHEGSSVDNDEELYPDEMNEEEFEEI